ncbi:MAG: cold shock domain-containing protein [Oceanospirillales bacterium]|nr:cold shock domain-containing protein [Oceanospirillales bacterium]MBR9889671.1 cold shock domain-containing protein [Oceanospirillales bacterium]
MHTGTVKWFNNAKGFGFIVSPDFEEDLFVHYSAIITEGYKSLKTGQSVRFEASPKDVGIHAVNITPLAAG